MFVKIGNSIPFLDAVRELCASSHLDHEYLRVDDVRRYDNSALRLKKA